MCPWSDSRRDSCITVFGSVCWFPKMKIRIWAIHDKLPVKSLALSLKSLLDWREFPCSILWIIHCDKGFHSEPCRRLYAVGNLEAPLRSRWGISLCLTCPRSIFPLFSCLCHFNPNHNTPQRSQSSKFLISKEVLSLSQVLQGLKRPFTGIPFSTSVLLNLSMGWETHFLPIHALLLSFSWHKFNRIFLI